MILGVDLKVLLGNCLGFLWVYAGNMEPFWVDQLPYATP